MAAVSVHPRGSCVPSARAPSRPRGKRKRSRKGRSRKLTTKYCEAHEHAAAAQSRHDRHTFACLGHAYANGSPDRRSTARCPLGHLNPPTAGRRRHSPQRQRRVSGARGGGRWCVAVHRGARKRSARLKGQEVVLADPSARGEENSAKVCATLRCTASLAQGRGQSSPPSLAASSPRSVGACGNPMICSRPPAPPPHSWRSALALGYSSQTWSCLSSTPPW